MKLRAVGLASGPDQPALFRLAILTGVVSVMIAGLCLGAQTSAVDEPSPADLPSDTLVVREALGIALPRRTVSSIIANTPLDAWFTAHRGQAPKAGEAIRFPDGAEAQWQRIVSDSNGWFPNDPPAERFVAVTIDRATPARFILEGMGHDYVYVNGTPRSGNPYRQKDQYEAWEPHFDYSRIPIDLHAGHNLLLFRYSRGTLKIKLSPVTGPVVFNADDVTLPDAVMGTSLDAWGSIALVNSTEASLKDYKLICIASGGKADTIDVPQVPAMGVRKVAFRVRSSARADKGTFPAHLTLLGRAGGPRAVVDTLTLSLRVVNTTESRRETFVSSIDGSVQYYAVTPPRPGRFADRPALFLSLHGAGVEALNQAASYAPKTWGYVVAPTNRRPYGFSWEDWGRLDALEVLDLVNKKYDIDRDRIYLTGHSMGGHGT